MTENHEQNIREVPKLLAQLYAIVGALESNFGRKFTPDGHLVGSVGEIMAAYIYDLRLLRMSEAGHDAVTADGRKVQIKATQGRSVALRSEPEHIIVLRISRDGSSKEIFNGPGNLVWRSCGRKQDNGQCAIGLARLEELMKHVDPADRIVIVREWPS
jgi:hypothetical protein